jgi:hypothetical protein
LEDSEGARDFKVEVRLQTGKNSAQIGYSTLVLRAADVIYPTVLAYPKCDQRHEERGKEPPSFREKCSPFWREDIEPKHEQIRKLTSYFDALQF